MRIGEQIEQLSTNKETMELHSLLQMDRSHNRGMENLLATDRLFLLCVQQWFSGAREVTWAKLRLHKIEKVKL